MANRDLLREAVADAKTLRETAIANAKAVLEESFTPQLKSMLSEKISQLDEEDELSEADKVIKEKEEMDEAKEIEKEGKEETNEAKDDITEEENLEEELDLEELLAELELEEGEDMDEAKDMDESDHMDEGDDMYEAEEEMETEEEVNLEDMSEEELKSFIEDVIEDMIEDGELVPGPNADESEEEEGDDTDDGMTGDADVDIEVDDIDLEEGKKEVDEGQLNELFDLGVWLAENFDITVEALHKALALSPALIGAGMLAIAKGKEAIAAFLNKNKEVVDAAKGEGGKKATTSEAEAELKEAKLIIKHLQSELNEVNLLNSKLLYTNKIFKAKNLTENQKIKVLKAFDKAESVKEAKVIYGSLSENLIDKSTKSNIRESMGMASKPAGVAPKRTITEQKVVEEDAMVSRFKKLAGIK